MYYKLFNLIYYLKNKKFTLAPIYPMLASGGTPGGRHALGECTKS
jgi:hypothetical protein